MKVRVSKSVSQCHRIVGTQNAAYDFQVKSSHTLFILITRKMCLPHDFKRQQQQWQACDTV